VILFVGCSYTWGSGLQYEYLHNKKGWSIDEINQVLPTNYMIEHLDYNADEYRKQHTWANLVSKELNESYVIGTYTNGGSNLTTIKSTIEHARIIARENSISTVVIQFSDCMRDIPEKDLKDDMEEFIHNQILFQINEVTKQCLEFRGTSDPNLKDHKYPNLKYPAWVGLSSQKDMGDILKKYYFKNFIPIHFDGKEYTSFANNIDKGVRICDSLPGVDDEHLNSMGVKIIADSITKKLKQYK